MGSFTAIIPIRRETFKKMLRAAVTHMVILAVVLLPLSDRVFGQSEPRVATTTASNPARPPDRSPDFKKLIAKTEDVSKLDAKALDKIDRRQPRKEGLSTGQKWAIALGIIGTAALVFVLVKNADSACVVTGQSGCVGVNVNCTCRE